MGIGDDKRKMFLLKYIKAGMHVYLYKWGGWDFQYILSFGKTGSF